jgi:Zn-dependent peptidase ImmA (M78 family)
MKIEGLKILSREEIDELAIKLLTYIDPDHFSYPKCTDLKKVTAFLTSKHGYVFDYSSTIGFAEDGGKIIGAFHPGKKVIIIDPSIVTDEYKFNFTMAHELGHVALHRKLKFPSRKTPLPNIKKNKSEEYTDVDWMEWQANKYAGGFLVPVTMLVAKIKREQNRMGIKADGRIVLDNDPKSKMNADKIILQLCMFFGVSRTCINMRLSDLDLTNDNSWQPRTAFEVASCFFNSI